MAAKQKKTVFLFSWKIKHAFCCIVIKCHLSYSSCSKQRMDPLKNNNNKNLLTLASNLWVIYPLNYKKYL